MISIVVSSHNKSYFRKFIQSVQQTIGVDYEIIQVKNPGLMGICEAYNQGAQQAQFPYICFSHEDIIFHTDNWGKILINDFESDPAIGLIGIAGSGYKSWTLSGWHTSQKSPNRFLAVNVVHVSPEQSTRHNINESNDFLVPVASIDGCFMFTSRNVAQQIHFDQTLFTSYHCYDIDYSLQVNQHFKVVVDFNILLSHFSGGSYDEKWFTETIKLHKKWKNKLPYKIGEVTKSEIASEEEAAFYGILSAVFRINKKLFINFLKECISFKYIKLVGIKRIPQIVVTSYRVIKNYI
ncbi:glycosyltransferase [Spirosoma daeguense]